MLPLQLLRANPEEEDEEEEEGNEEGLLLPPSPEVAAARFSCSFCKANCSRCFFVRNSTLGGPPLISVGNGGSL